MNNRSGKIFSTIAALMCILVLALTTACAPGQGPAAISSPVSSADVQEQPSAVEETTEPKPEEAEPAEEVPTEVKPTAAPYEYTNYYFRNEKLLNEHYQKHGIEMGFDSPESYEKAASDVINDPDVLSKAEAEDDDMVYYIESTNEFVILSADGFIRTYFYPSAGKAYYDRQGEELKKVDTGGVYLSSGDLVREIIAENNIQDPEIYLGYGAEFYEKYFIFSKAGGNKFLTVMCFNKDMCSEEDARSFDVRAESTEITSKPAADTDFEETDSFYVSYGVWENAFDDNYKELLEACYAVSVDPETMEVVY